MRWAKNGEEKGDEKTTLSASTGFTEQPMGGRNGPRTIMIEEASMAADASAAADDEDDDDDD